jgi:hypothetical protein
MNVFGRRGQMGRPQKRGGANTFAKRFSDTLNEVADQPSGDEAPLD